MNSCKICKKNKYILLGIKKNMNKIFFFKRIINKIYDTNRNK